MGPWENHKVLCPLGGAGDGSSCSEVLGCMQGWRGPRNSAGRGLFTISWGACCVWPSHAAWWETQAGPSFQVLHVDSAARVGPRAG